MTSISQERAGWNAVAGHPPMRRRDQWGARRSYTDARAVIEPATRVFVHISITNPSAYNSHDAHARAIEAIGISRFPATGISYNRMFMAGSTVVREGQPIGRRGAHTVNDFKRSTCSTSGCPGRGSSLTAPDWNLNYVARAYVWCANVNNAVPAAVVELIALTIYTDYKAGFITKAAAQNIHGHRCVSAKSCPADRMWALMGTIQARVNQLIAQGPQEEDMPLDATDLTKIKATVLDALNTAIPYQSPSVAEFAKARGWGNQSQRTALEHTLRLVNVLNDNVAPTQALIKQAIAEAADDPEVPIELTPEQIEALGAAAVRHLLGQISVSEPVNPT